MSSWWTLGEHSGHFGKDLSTYQIACAFCEEKGNYSVEHHAEKKKPNGRKVLNFDTLKCGNCGGYVMVMWSASEYGPQQGLHDYYRLPWPIGVGEGSDNWPAAVKRMWKQAHDNLNNQNYDAAAVMSRSALQAVMRSQKAVGKDLYNEIEDLATKGVLPAVIQNWSHEVRQLAKPAAHPEVDEEETSPEDAEDIVEFLDFLLKYTYDVPAQIEEYRKRRNPDPEEQDET